ncbi:hypothetical protein [Oceanobacillus damuensis]|uniref:hypothetical protein n=1 Tax=Oceanobacillus damuensis TaxID=937928 RepID=UPI00082DB44B|nr:hypothetical protein [Oceanobacillus damuensis]
MNNPNRNIPTDFGDKLLYYGGMITTIGSVISFVGSTIIYEQRFLDNHQTQGTNDNHISNQQFIQMQKQIDELQRKIDEIQKKGST